MVLIGNFYEQVVVTQNHWGKKKSVFVLVRVILPWTGLSLGFNHEFLVLTQRRVIDSHAIPIEILTKDSAPIFK